MSRNFLLIIIGFLTAWFIQDLIFRMLKTINRISDNYMGEKIPDIMGITIIISSISAGLIGIIFYLISPFQMYFFSFIGILMGFVGLIDDLLGNNASKGFKGHIKKLYLWHLTTGGLKAIVGVISSIIIGIQFSNNIIDFSINLLLVLFITNLINLLDTRPGRAIKGFGIILVPVLLASEQSHISYLYILIGVIIAYIPMDFKAKSMMGDTGANFLGVILSASIIENIKSMIFKIPLLLIVFSLNILSEKISFSKIIENNIILSYIDKLGTIPKSR